ncbi:MAG: histidine kinase dimerization/phospho-acceptor domain-containing protein [Myxococcota bacterium]
MIDSDAAACEPVSQSLNAQTKRAFSALSTPLWVFDIQCKEMVWANPSAVRLWRASDLDSLLERDFASDMSAHTARNLQSYLEAFRQGETRVENWTFFPDGNETTVRCHCSGILSTDGRLLMLVEGVTHEGYSFIDAVMRSVASLILVVDQYGTLVRVNRRALDVAASNRNQLLGVHVSDSPFGIPWPPSDDGRTFEAYTLAQGTRRPVLWSVTLLDEAAFDKRLWLLAGLDVAEDRALRRELEARDRLASLGRLAAGVSHEINNPLSVIMAGLQELASGPTGSAEHAIVDDCLVEAERIATIVEELTVLSRSDDNDRAAFELGEVIRWITLVTSRELSPRAALRCQVDGSLVLAGPRSHLTHALLSIVLHAADSLPRERDEPHPLDLHAELESEETVRFSVRYPDTSELEEQTFFEPFLEVGQRHRQLGLSVAHALVTRAGATMQAHRARGETCLELRWPCGLQPARV